MYFIRRHVEHDNFFTTLEEKKLYFPRDRVADYRIWLLLLLKNGGRALLKKPLHLLLASVALLLILNFAVGLRRSAPILSDGDGYISTRNAFLNYTDFRFDEELARYTGNLVHTLYKPLVKASQVGSSAVKSSALADNSVNAVLASLWWPKSNYLVLLTQGNADSAPNIRCHIPRHDTKLSRKTSAFRERKFNFIDLFPVVYRAKGLVICDLSKAANYIYKYRYQPVTLYSPSKLSSLKWTPNVSDLLPTFATFYWNDEFVQFINERTEKNLPFVGPRDVYSGKRKFNMCAVTQLKNMAQDITEWVNYHRKLGIEQFFIYDNGSTDNITAVVDELNGRYSGEIVQMIYWPFRKSQVSAYLHSKLITEHWCDWSWYGDVDEYIMPQSLAMQLGVGDDHPEDIALLKEIYKRELIDVALLHSNKTCHSPIDADNPNYNKSLLVRHSDCYGPRYNVSVESSIAQGQNLYGTSKEFWASNVTSLVNASATTLNASAQDSVRTEMRHQLESAFSNTAHHQICLKSHAFGSSGVIRRRGGVNLTSTFLHSTKPGTFERFPKCFVQTAWASFRTSIHYFDINLPMGGTLSGSRSYHTIPESELYINHYKLRTWEDFIVRYAGRNGPVKDWRLPEEGLTVHLPPHKWHIGHIDIVNAVYRDTKLYEFKQKYVDEIP